jgi:hypothetical protein
MDYYDVEILHALAREQVKVPVQHIGLVMHRDDERAVAFPAFD